MILVVVDDFLMLENVEILRRSAGLTVLIAKVCVCLVDELDQLRILD
jgi:hypothetical protein